MSQNENPKSIKTEDLTGLFHLSIKENKAGEISSHIQIHGSKADVLPMVMQVFLAEPEAVKILKEVLKLTKGFKKEFPELASSFEKLSKQKK